MAFTVLTLLLLFTVPALLMAGYFLVVLAMNGIGVDTYPNPDSR